MFGSKNDDSTDYQAQIRELKHSHELRLKELEQEKALALKEKEFELKHFKDDEVKNLSQEVSKLERQVAVLQKENEMLGKITNLNADIIDIKDLVANLINKLPEIKLNNLTLNGNSDKQRDSV